MLAKDYSPSRHQGWNDRQELDFWTCSLWAILSNWRRHMPVGLTTCISRYNCRGQKDPYRPCRRIARHINIPYCWRWHQHSARCRRPAECGPTDQPQLCSCTQSQADNDMSQGFGASLSWCRDAKRSQHR